MAFKYNNELLAPYLALDQGDKIQAECSYYIILCLLFILINTTLRCLDRW